MLASRRARKEQQQGHGDIVENALDPFNTGYFKQQGLIASQPVPLKIQPVHISLPPIDFAESNPDWPYGVIGTHTAGLILKWAQENLDIHYRFFGPSGKIVWPAKPTYTPPFDPEVMAGPNGFQLVSIPASNYKPIPKTPGNKMGMGIREVVDRLEYYKGARLIRAGQKVLPGTVIAGRWEYRSQSWPITVWGTQMKFDPEYSYVRDDDGNTNPWAVIYEQAISAPPHSIGTNGVYQCGWAFDFGYWHRKPPPSYDRTWYSDIIAGASDWMFDFLDKIPIASQLLEYGQKGMCSAEGADKAKRQREYDRMRRMGYSKKVAKRYACL